MPDEPNLKNIPKNLLENAANQRWEEFLKQQRDRELRQEDVRRLQEAAAEYQNVRERAVYFKKFDMPQFYKAQEPVDNRVAPAREELNAEFIPPPMIEENDFVGVNHAAEIQIDALAGFDDPGYLITGDQMWRVTTFAKPHTDSVARLLLDAQHPMMERLRAALGPNERGDLGSGVNAFVAISEPREIGYVIGYVAASPEQFVVVVDEPWRRTGVATAMLRHMRDYCINAGFHRYRFSAYASDVGTVKSLIKAGFPLRDVEQLDIDKTLLIFNALM